MSEKPVIFISHSHKDDKLKKILQQEIQNCFDHQVGVFAADIKTGENWFDKVMGQLNKAEAIVVLITPDAVKESHWVWFELGYFWAKHDEALKNPEGKQRIYYPLCTRNVVLPNPVKDLQIQVGWLSKRDNVDAFFEQLCKQFNSGDSKKADVDRIVRAVNPRLQAGRIEHNLWDEPNEKDYPRG